MARTISLLMLDSVAVSTNWPRLVGLVVAGFVTWCLYVIVRNFTWHPLAGFPGPRFAAITPLYKAYIDCVARCSFVHTLEKLHGQYGKSPRIPAQCMQCNVAIGTLDRGHCACWAQ